MMRGGKRIAFLTTLLVSLGIYMTLHYNNNHPPASSILCHATRSLDDYSHRNAPSSSQSLLSDSSPSSYYLNLNSLNATAQGNVLREHLLVLTPLTRPDDVSFLPEYLQRLERTSYPNELISIGLLLVDPAMRKAVEPIVQRYLDGSAETWRQRYNNNRKPKFHAITVYERHMVMNSQEDSKTAYGRSIMARARNFLLSAALRDFHSWVAWIDIDIVKYPSSIFEDLMSADVDVIVPNCLLDRSNFWAYDRRNWQETDYSLEMQKRVGEDFIMMEGLSDGASGRSLLVDMPTHLGMDLRVPLDAVGATFTLVKSHVHREGANFPPFLYQHNIESEAFGKVANAMGFSVYGVPGYSVYHADRS